MARKRTIEPNIWQDEDFGMLSPIAQLIYIGCITQADDDGRLIGHPSVLRSTIFPYGIITMEQVFDAIEELNIKMKNFVYYEANNTYFVQLGSWEKHQKQQSDRRQKSLYPAPSKEILSACVSNAKQVLHQVSKEVSKEVSGSDLTTAKNNKQLDKLRKDLEGKGIIKKTKLI